MPCRNYIKLLMLTFLLSNLSYSQVIDWKATSGPEGGWTNSVCFNSNAIFTAAGPYLYRSTDNGQNWQKIQYSTNSMISKLYLYLFKSPSGALFVGDYGVVWKSTDNGNNWAQHKVDESYSYSINNMSFDSLGNIYTTSPTTIFKSTDNGDNWKILCSVPQAYQSAFLTITGKQTLILANDKGLFRSTNDGSSWDVITNGLPPSNSGLFVAADITPHNLFTAKNGYIFAKLWADRNNYYYSKDDGKTWGNFTGYNTHNDRYLYEDPNNKLWEFSKTFIRYSTNYGNSWSTPKTPTPSILTFNSMNASPDGSLFGTDRTGLWKSTDNGANWELTAKGIAGAGVQKLFYGPDNSIAAVSTYYDKLYRTADYGMNWNYLPGWELKSPGSMIQNVFVKKDEIYLAVRDKFIYSKDKGNSWSTLTSPIYYSSSDMGDNGLIAASNNSGTSLSTDFGLTWKNIKTWSDGTSGIVKINRFNEILNAHSGQIFISKDLGQTWTAISPANLGNISCLEVTSRGYIIAGFGTPGGQAIKNISQVMISKDNGQSWKYVDVGYLNDQPYNVSRIKSDNNGTIYVISSENINYTKDCGSTWKELNAIPSIYDNLTDIIIDNKGFLYSSSELAGVYQSSVPFLPILKPDIYTTKPKDSKVTISWSKNSSTDFLKYRIYGGLAHNPAAVLDSTTGINDTVKTINGLTNGKQYYFVVSAVDKDGNEAFSGEISSTPLPAPTIPVLLSLINDSKDAAINPLLKWKKSQNTLSYQFQLSKDSTFTNVLVSDTALTDTTRQLSSLLNLTKFFWRVKANGNLEDSQWSEVWSFTTIIAVPAVPVTFGPSNNSINLPVKQTFKWQGAQRAETYHFQLSKDQVFSSFVVNDSTMADTAKTIDLANGTKYYWRVRAKNTGGISQWSDSWNFTTIVAMPDLPVLTYPQNNAVNVAADVTLKWNKSPRTEKYTLDIAADSNFTDIAFCDSAITDTLKKTEPLTFDRRYYWRVKAKNIAGETNWSPVWTFKTIIAAPNYPYLCQPVNNALNQPIVQQLKWQKLKDAEKYHLQISTAADFSSMVINDSTQTDTLKQVPGLKNKTSYYWRVRAINIGGNSPWSEVWQFKTIVAIPAKPVLVSPANGSNGSAAGIKLSWNPVQDAESYRIKVYALTSKNNVIVKDLILVDSSLTSTSKDIAVLKTGAKYSWLVNAKNAAGEGDSSEVWSFTTILPSPADLNAVTEGMKKVKLTWTDKSDNELGFILERKKENEIGYKVIDTLNSNATSFIDSTVESGTKYNYRLKAFTSFVNSVYSNESQITTLTSVDDLKGMPSEYTLMQNYPNPFNPSTIIRYSLIAESKVRISVYNSLGQIVSELVNKVQPGGYYEQIFNANNLPSGIYIYSISVQSTDGRSNFSSVKKMMLVK